MTLETKTALIDVVEYAASKLNIKKGATYNAIADAIESNMQSVHIAPVADSAASDDWLEAAKPKLRIHRNLESCEACSA